MCTSTQDPPVRDDFGVQVATVAAALFFDHIAVSVFDDDAELEIFGQRTGERSSSCGIIPSPGVLGGNEGLPAFHGLFPAKIAAPQDMQHHGDRDPGQGDREPEPNEQAPVQARAHEPREASHASSRGST